MPTAQASATILNKK